MKYFPLEALDNFNDQAILDTVIPSYMDLASEKVGKPIVVEDDFPDFLFSDRFFNPKYVGKYDAVNEYFMYDQEVNSFVLKGIPMMDVNQRRTEWRDMFGEAFVLTEWAKSKMVYKMDSEFFHEIKNTTNLKISSEMLGHLPFNIMYFDLSDVENLGEFKGVWVDVHNVAPEQYMLIFYMVTDGSLSPAQKFAIFSFYCRFDFSGETKEIEMDPRDLVTDVTDDFYIRDYQTVADSGTIVRQPLERSDDHRSEIVIALMQVLEFLHADIDDIIESPVTKSTYKPSKTVKNKFSEVRCWDVGVRYGKAIKLAKNELKQLVESEGSANGSSEKKSRKPVRPHIRSAHWQRYHVGEGRQQIRVNWIPPVYVCGNKEIPVTIHKVSK